MTYLVPSLTPLATIPTKPQPDSIISAGKARNTMRMQSPFSYRPLR